MAKILLDPGHSGSDPGAILGNRKEKDDTLNLALSVGEILQFNNQTVNYTRTTDIELSLAQRTAKENSDNYDYFISFHRNAFNGTAQGVETYTYQTDNKGRELAYKIQNRLEKIFKGRGVKSESFFVLINTRCPAVLIEVGFIDSIEDNKIFDSKYKEIVELISEAILEQVGVTMKLPETSNNSNGDTYYRVVTGSFKEKKYAENRVSELLKAGFSSFIDIFKK